MGHGGQGRFLDQTSFLLRISVLHALALPSSSWAAKTPVCDLFVFVFSSAIFFPLISDFSTRHFPL